MSRRIKYTHVDAQGLRWRFVGSRPISELGDQLMRDTGFELPGILNRPGKLKAKQTKPKR